MYPFGGEQHQQGLSFEAGETIKVTQALPGGWWEGEKDGARGWFPSSYVQVLEVSTLFLEFVSFVLLVLMKTSSILEIQRHKNLSHRLKRW